MTEYTPERPMSDYRRDLLLMSISQDVRRLVKVVEGNGQPGLIKDVEMLKAAQAQKPGVGIKEKVGFGAAILAGITIIPQVIAALRS